MLPDALMSVGCAVQPSGVGAAHAPPGQKVIDPVTVLNVRMRPVPAPSMIANGEIPPGIVHPGIPHDGGVV
jgi:hypothetical protein